MNSSLVLRLDLEPDPVASIPRFPAKEPKSEAVLRTTNTPKTDPNLDATTPCTEFPTVPRQPPYTLCMPGYPPRTCTLPFGVFNLLTYIQCHVIPSLFTYSPPTPWAKCGTHGASSV